MSFLYFFRVVLYLDVVGQGITYPCKLFYSASNWLLQYAII